MNTLMNEYPNIRYIRFSTTIYLSMSQPWLSGIS